MRFLFRVTACEKESLGRRMLCALGRVSMLLALLIGVGCVLYAYRYPMAAKIWHWRHGSSVTMGNYEVPVPEHWLITNQNSAGLTLMNTSPNFPKDGKFHTAAVIS